MCGTRRKQPRRTAIDVRRSWVGGAWADEFWLADPSLNRPCFPVLIHTVYFWLKPELTDAQRAEFRRGVESLARIPSVEEVYIGAPAAVAARPVVDSSFSVGLTVLCRDVAAHDAYQVDPIHLKFVETCRQFWSRVQIYDAQT